MLEQLRSVHQGIVRSEDEPIHEHIHLKMFESLLSDFFAIFQHLKFPFLSCSHHISNSRYPKIASQKSSSQESLKEN